MKLLLLIICLICCVFSQLFDYCAENNDKETCLSNGGCCFSVLKFNDTSSSQEMMQFKTCFKRYKENETETCRDYKVITEEFGNDLAECSCNDIF